MSAEQSPDGYLFDVYRRYIGEPEDRTDIYAGFSLFLGGIGLGIISLVLFLWSTNYAARSDAYFTWTEPAYALVMVALPILMLGIVVLLPSERRVQYASIAGVAVTVVAVGGFLYAYPTDWNGYGADYTAEVIAVYAVGLAALTASTGAALIAHYLDMAREAQRIEPTDDAESESYTDEEIQSDIDAAMEDVELSWGGVQKTEHKRLSFSENEFDEVDVDSVGTKTTRSSGVDAQVAGLKGLKGGDTKTTTSSATVDDQTQKLKELREQQRAEELATDDSSGLVAAVTGRLASLRNRLGRN
ncbi:permease [Natronolimnobius sp. AArcel1]|uniref:DUF7139 domain-containing protein n=1 Tax=Natronolimnobius sp. AArcel1 TaxID=1679093 RepID=UPI0013ECF370|nr:permease [Natronolimnobius sp. AArcel1]NGM70874.1 permease [Natronolimnobius sp. AArcel1]